jgi:hypothetical protein
MARLTGLAVVLAVFAFTMGCTRRVDNGMPCSSLSGPACQADPRCELQSGGCCGGWPAVCVPKGSPIPECACPSCDGLDEATCKHTNGCRADYCTECSCTPTFAACVALGAPPVPCPGGCNPSCGCNGMNEQACIAAESSLGCTPSYCPDCHGGNTYTGCLGPNQGVSACPAVCPVECHGNSDCSGGQLCFAPGQPGCGTCRPLKSCSTDANCAAGEVCDVAACSCTGGLVCTPACSSKSCPAGQSCGSNGHCAPVACSSTGQCPAYFDCVYPPGDGNGTAYCARIACSSDSDCGGGYCVDSACYGTAGICTYPPG